MPSQLPTSSLFLLFLSLPPFWLNYASSRRWLVVKHDMSFSCRRRTAHAYQGAPGDHSPPLGAASRSYVLPGGREGSRGGGMVARRSRGWPMQQAHAQAYPYNNKVGHGLDIGGAWAPPLPVRPTPPRSQGKFPLVGQQVMPQWTCLVEIFWRTPEDVLSFPPAFTLHSPEACSAASKGSSFGRAGKWVALGLSCSIGEYSLFIWGLRACHLLPDLRCAETGVSFSEHHSCRGDEAFGA